ncbi:hypothetical protein LTR51_004336 [Lithohypha guttulata]|nr:hypothetical protein LTR51_004336 [Lithohypha guttulata]
MEQHLRTNITTTSYIDFSDTQATNLEIAVNFERSNWALGSATQDDFYKAPANTSSLPPGSVIKVQYFVNTTSFALPPNTALSRLSYTTKNLLNDTIPASAYILWPYLPLTYPNLSSPRPGTNSSKFPVVAWAHGSSGVFAECRPSNLRNLESQYSAPYELALSGYVVIGIAHPYLVGSAAADDLFYAVQAAQSAFATRLSKEFVIMGHSQGGSAAWASAIRQHNTPVDGYLGSIAASPSTNLSGLITALGQALPPLLPMLGTQAIKALHPNFNISRLLTAEGELLADFPTSDRGALLHPNWTTVPEVADFFGATAGPGTLPISGPLLVLQGTSDLVVPYQFTDAAVAQTCAINNGRGVHYAKFAGVTHVPVLYASRRIWLDFLTNRFSTVGNVTTSRTCVTVNHTSLPFPVENYQRELGHRLELNTQSYQQGRLGF